MFDPFQGVGCVAGCRVEAGWRCLGTFPEGGLLTESCRKALQLRRSSRFFAPLP